MKQLFELHGRTALVTGSSGGLGLTMARGLAAVGATVVLNGRNQDKLSRATESLSNEGLPAWDCAFDVSDAEQVSVGVERILERTGRIDVLINNAGIMRRGRLEELELSDWKTVLGTNLTAPFLVAQKVAQGMMDRQEGKIINICSLMTRLARPTTGAYAAAKGGLEMLTKAMATEWTQYNIQVNGIGPGYFVTEMTQKLADDPDFTPWLRDRAPAQRWGDPEELIGPTVFLASAASSFISGQVIFVDGGLMACV